MPKRAAAVALALHRCGCHAIRGVVEATQRARRRERRDAALPRRGRGADDAGAVARGIQMRPIAALVVVDRRRAIRRAPASYACAAPTRRVTSVAGMSPKPQQTASPCST